MSDEELKAHIKKIWERHWKYFTTSDLQTAPKVTEPFKGLDLPWEVIEKLYVKNAYKFYRLKPL